jgi:tetratricopeptide (TPR) repeat protein
MSDSGEPSSASANHAVASGPARNRDDSPTWATALVLFGAVAAFVALASGGPSEGDFAQRVQAVKAALERAKRPNRIAALERACGRADCECAAVAAREGVDADPKAVVELFEAVRVPCEATPLPRGLHAEALVRDGQDAEGRREAEQVLRQNPRDPYALYAMALIHQRAGQSVQALSSLQEAIDGGRGGTAYLLQGLAYFQMNRFDEAKQAFKAALALEPEDVDALYNLAVTAHKQRRFHEARETYIKVTRADPAHTSARYNLGLLAQTLGSLDEARHHLAKLEQIAPGDPLVEKLRATLSTPVPQEESHSDGAGALPSAPVPQAPGAADSPGLPQGAPVHRAPAQDSPATPSPKPVAPKPVMPKPVVPKPGPDIRRDPVQPPAVVEHEPAPVPESSTPSQ